jgi:hypothetical protein
MQEHPSLKKFIESVPSNACILTLNYDCVLDQGLHLSNRWSPRGGYVLSSFPGSDKDNASIENIRLVKLHGSCNFRDRNPGQPYPDIEISERIFPGIAAHLNETSSDAPHVLVMSYVKEFHNGIFMLWNHAISSLAGAQKLTIIGCSLREEDTFLRFALYHFGMARGVDKFQIDIVDVSDASCERIKEKVRKIVASPGKYEIRPFGGGLESYLCESLRH